MATDFLTKNLLHPQARVQAPWIKVSIGTYTFGAFDRKTKANQKDNSGYFTQFNVQYPTYVSTLSIKKINGQVNQYTLKLDYPITPLDDPNFIEKVLSSVSKTRKIVFSYGDASMPSFVYKDEEAIITKASQSFDLQGSKISYTIEAVSGAVLSKTGSFTFINTGKKKPSDEIRRVFFNSSYGLQSVFKGMNKANFDQLVRRDDKAVQLESKTNISPLDYITYLVGCMQPADNTQSSLSDDMYILTIHDDTVYDSSYAESSVQSGSFFKVSRTSNYRDRADAYEIDIGYSTSAIVTAFTIENNENFSLFYDYNTQLSQEQFSRRINDDGKYEYVFAPMYTSGNDKYLTRSEDTIWFTKMTRYPISATIKIQGLLRPATLMQYVRLNVIFPGGRKHVSSGLYIITKQLDEIGASGYFTTLNLTRIGD